MTSLSRSTRLPESFDLQFQQQHADDEDDNETKKKITKVSHARKDDVIKRF